VVLNKLQRFYNVQFEFNHDFPADDLISGKLDLKESVYQVMLSLSDVAEIQFLIKDNIISIEKK
jgi:hypothetical protein